MASFMASKMERNEAITIVGARRFSISQGYSNKTKFVGKFEENRTLDEMNRIDRVFTAIDGLSLKSIKSQVHQFYEQDMLREMNKAYIGFKGDSKEEELKHDKRMITTGRWG